MATVKEIKLKKNGAMVSPVVLIGSVKNLDGTKYEDKVTNLLNSKSNTGHTHDDRYYTESEITNLLNGKANSSHSHDDVYPLKPKHYVNRQSYLDSDLRVDLPSLEVGQMCFYSVYVEDDSGDGSFNLYLPSGGKYMFGNYGNGAIAGTTVSGGHNIGYTKDSSGVYVKISN